MKYILRIKKNIKNYFVLLLIFILFACNNTIIPSEDKISEITWDEINENGVDEELLIENIDKEKLEYIANELQNLCNEIEKKSKEDKDYWLKGTWHSDALDSKEYKNVLALKEEAMKPLFLIIYKSDNAGMYEWICAKALEEISGFDFTNENNGNGWTNSKEFLEMFINRIIK